MSKILHLISLIFIFHINLSAGFLPNKIYKSFENKVKQNVGMGKPNYDQFILKEKQKKTITPKQRKQYLKKQFVQKHNIAKVNPLVKEKISIEIEASQFFDSLNQEHKKPINME